MKITKIEQQKKDPQRYSVFLKGEFAFGLHESILLKAGLHTGDTLTADQVKQFVHEDELFRAREKAYNLLQYRERSVEELRSRLHRKDFQEATVESVISDLMEKGYLDDWQFARTYAEDQLTRKNIGPIRLRAELSRKRVSDRIIDTVIEEMYEKYSVMELATRAAQKKTRTLKDVDYDTAYRRLTGYLGRRGFSWDVISQVVQQELNN